jgi:anti-sigma factor RsiW
MNTGSGPFSSSFSEADLHSFVDGRLEPSRQVEMARRLKSHAADRARTEAWREQNELIRATFSEVESETLPVSLCLTTPARLRCVSSDGLPLGGPDSANPGKPRFTSEAKRRRARLMAISTLMICASVAGAWIMYEHPAAPADHAAQVRGRGLDEALAGRTVEAMSGVLASGHSQTRGLPAIKIPDLSGSGFTFTGASAQQADPPALLLSYEDETGQRIVIGAANAGQTGSALTPYRHAVTWHRSGIAFALTGTVEQSRLNAIAASLQTSAGTPGK